MSNGNFTKAPVQVGACLTKVITNFRDSSGHKSNDNYVGGGHPKIICKISKQAWMPALEATENLYLIAEAFNVANETGLTPSQLRAQRDELLDAFKAIGAADEADLIGASDPAIRGLLYAAIRVARAAIAKAEDRS
ncbi:MULTISPECIES: hypothetical protein [Thalassospira]|jgi:hypothetical protein|uniref:hypothetical protein n=1 Tax=Thalassospira TaxID=168934 RepID=UPI0008DEA650|nr:MULTISPECIES: hypothetical protein [Thalassospira]MBL4839361.1 hypothetical protein [Thalassospira sp.]MDM7975201.1 hypothetical protein [Thalassospira xiamenensis]OHZ01013.1 hypothetical protein BC440_09250 [Thalassospira sp. MIT1004]PXX36245.1 hypothetical protein C7967_101638 [Thalassospira sp. 11-3]QPL37450.1 hypothetical protein IT971_09255 [Thalassospira sp. B30-1]